MAQVKLSRIVKHYDDGTEVIHGIDLDIADGEFIVLVGPSGCGKSTLLRMIAGLESITGGELHIGDRLANDIPPAKRGLAMVFQSYALYPHMSVYDNMAFSLKLADMSDTQIDIAVQQAADVLQIAHLLHRKPRDLSGGQRQRVAIGRAIVRKPALFLFDEPLSNLDASLRVQMRLELSRLHRELKATMIYVTHDQVEAMTLGQRIVVFNAGRIEQVGTPLDLYERPATLFVAGFLGTPKMNLLPARVDSMQRDSVTLRLSDGSVLTVPAQSGGVSVGDAVTLGVRAEHVGIGSETPDAQRPGLQVSIEQVEYLGDSCIAYARLRGSDGLIAFRHAPHSGSIRAGDVHTLRLAPEQCHLFGSDGRSCRASS